MLLIIFLQNIFLFQRSREELQSINHFRKFERFLSFVPDKKYLYIKFDKCTSKIN